MPLRLLIYMARVYEKLIDNHTIYRTSLTRIPRPEFYVLYSGDYEYADNETLRLSDAFMDNPHVSGLEDSLGVKSFLELEVPVININKGSNENLTQRSSHLSGYVTFITKIRELKKSGLVLEKAIGESVKHCLENNILTDILPEISSEVINMLFVELNIEDAKRIWLEEGRAEGEARGEARGKTRGKAEGKAEGNIQTAKIALQMGLPIDSIMKLTGLSQSEIEALAIAPAETPEA